MMVSGHTEHGQVWLCAEMENCNHIKPNNGASREIARRMEFSFRYAIRLRIVWNRDASENQRRGVAVDYDEPIASCMLRGSGQNTGRSWRAWTIVSIASRAI